VTIAGFILTGADVVSARWPLDGPRLLPFETSMPGVFAVGDVRHGSVKRVAGAVGEGSVAIGSVHQYLLELERATTGRHLVVTARLCDASFRQAAFCVTRDDDGSTGDACASIGRRAGFRNMWSVTAR